MKELKAHFAAASTFYSKNRRWLMLGLLILCAVFPLISGDNYLKGMLIKIMIYGILASALNVINGYTGMFLLGSAGMICIGSYTEAILATRFGISFWLLLPLAGLFSALFGMLVTLPTIRLKGIYFSIITMGLSEIVRLVAQNATPLTGGAMGIKNIPAPAIFGFKLNGMNHYYYIILGLLVLCLFTISRVMKSNVGRALLSIREDDSAARSLGVNVQGYKALSFGFSAFWMGVVGAFMAPYYQFIDASMYTSTESFNILSMLIIGGQGTMIGPLIGAALSNTLSEAMRYFGEWRLVAYSALILATMWFRPQGIAGSSSASLTGQRRRKKLKRGHSA